jgi:hypothetical protein
MTSSSSLVACLLLLGAAACQPSVADANGQWSGEATEPGGGAVPFVLNLHATDTVLTGTASAPPDDSALAIEHGIIHGSELSFDINQATPDSNVATFSVSATISGDRMRGSVLVHEEGVTLPFGLTRNGAGAARGSGVASGGRSVTRAPGKPPQATGGEAAPQDAIPAILAAFSDHEVVGLGILSYANQDFDAFILDLIRDPAFPGRVDDIVVECGNSLYQPVLDRYIAGEDVSLSEVRQVWRNTTQPMCGLASFYEQLFPLVRRLNSRLPEGKQLRVLAGDPPIDWSTVKTRKDARPFGDRDLNIAQVMERDVLAQHRRALMIFGVRHLMHVGGSAVGRYERKLETQGGSHLTYVIMAHNGFGNGSPLSRFNDELEQRLASWPVRSLAPLASTWLDTLDYGYFFPGERGGPISARVDAYLYLGPRALLLNQPISSAGALDSAYLRELARRAAINDHQTTPARLLQGALDSSVFFNPHP